MNIWSAVFFPMVLALAGAGPAAAAETASCSGGEVTATSSPADGDMLMSPPAKFQISFSKPGTLAGVTLQDENNEPIEIGGAPVRTSDSAAELSLPTLPTGTYRLHWTGTACGKELSGDLSFMVHGH